MASFLGEDIVRRYHDSAAGGDVDQLQMLLKIAGLNIDAKNERGWTALMYAARNGHTSTVKLLLDNGCDPNVLNSSGQAAVSIASFWNHANVIKLLTKNGDEDGPNNSQEVPNFFSGNILDRAAHRRKDKTWLENLLLKPTTRVILLLDLNPVIHPRVKGSPIRLHLSLSEGLKPFLKDSPAVCLFLGLETPEGKTSAELTDDDKYAWFALNVSFLGQEKLREVLPNFEVLDPFPGALRINKKEAAIFAQARSLMAWHDRYQYCPTCGKLTRPDEGGYKRVCADGDCRSCQGVHNTCYPRLDPTLIMAVVSINRDKILLGRGKRFPPGMYSCLAGFMEPGESIEETCRREVLEEAGVQVGAVRYHSSQPWPMPASLMIGCITYAMSDEIKVDPDELEDARWFTRSDVVQMMNGKHPSGMFIPPKQAIAHVLIRAWINAGSNL